MSDTTHYGSEKIEGRRVMSLDHDGDGILLTAFETLGPMMKTIEITLTENEAQAIAIDLQRRLGLMAAMRTQARHAERQIERLNETETLLCCRCRKNIEVRLPVAVHPKGALFSLTVYCHDCRAPHPLEGKDGGET